MNTLPEYDFKVVAEIGWGALIAAAVFGLTAIVETSMVDNWQTWVISVGGGMARAGAGAALSRLVPKPS